MILRQTDQSHSSKGIHATTTAHDIDGPQVLADRLTTAHPDVLRELLSTFIHTLMGAEVDALCGADHGERSNLSDILVTNLFLYFEEALV